MTSQSLVRAPVVGLRHQGLQVPLLSRPQLGPDPRAFFLLWPPSAPPSVAEMGVQCLVWLQYHI